VTVALPGAPFLAPPQALTASSPPILAATSGDGLGSGDGIHSLGYGADAGAGADVARDVALSMPTVSVLPLYPQARDMLSRSARTRALTQCGEDDANGADVSTDASGSQVASLSQAASAVIALNIQRRKQQKLLRQQQKLLKLQQESPPASGTAPASDASDGSEGSGRDSAGSALLRDIGAFRAACLSAGQPAMLRVLPTAIALNANSSNSGSNGSSGNSSVQSSAVGVAESAAAAEAALPAWLVAESLGHLARALRTRLRPWELLGDGEAEALARARRDMRLRQQLESGSGQGQEQEQELEQGGFSLGGGPQEEECDHN